MRFRLRHVTEYHYAFPATESVGEIRLWPPDTPSQRVLSRSLELEPAGAVSDYVDYFGNRVEVFSVPQRHESLRVVASAEVETLAGPDRSGPLGVSTAEARLILRRPSLEHAELLLPTALVPVSGVRRRLKERFLDDRRPLGENLLDLNRWIHRNFRYVPGATDVTTPVPTVIQRREGVCQDFAHLLLAILREEGFPARYASGYIEAFDPETQGGLVGAAASHAWVEVLLPGGAWWGLDPTNDQPAGERHVLVATGRDYDDVAPLRGTYKGAGRQQLSVMVDLRRRKRRA